jgi:hypothetical protein
MPSVKDVLGALAASMQDYDKLVDCYGLTMLKSPGDLQIENGDIAVTKDGRDLKFGDTAYNALFRLVNGWRFNEPTFKLLFELVYEAKQKQAELEEHQNREPLSLVAMMGNSEAVATYHRMNDEIGATQMAYYAAATALLLAISAMLALFKIDVEAGPAWQTTGPLFGGHSVGAIIEATANNFRHRDEWAMTRPPNTRQLSSIQILAAALNEPISGDGSRHRLARDIGHEILDVLSGGNFETLAARIFEFANTLAERRKAGP